MYVFVFRCQGCPSVYYDHPSDSTERGGSVLPSSDSHEFGGCGKFVFFTHDMSIYKSSSMRRCAKKCQHSRPVMLSLENPAHKVGRAFAGPTRLGTWISGGLPLSSLVRAMYRASGVCTHSGLCWTPAFVLGVWDFGSCSVETAVWSAASKNPGPWVSSPVDNISCVVTACCWRD